MTMLTPVQKDMLAADLDRKHVKQRQQSGRSLSYVEGWHVVAEANRIFGFDGWNRETVETKCVTEKVREIGASKQPGWTVTYTAKVRVMVGSTIRDGCGTGHGIDRDLGQAHESAIKEAETDAMKRALMTFGNPFGLALYDKEQAHVSDEQPAHANAALDSQAIATDLIRELRACKNTRDLRYWGESPAIHDQIHKLADSDKDRVRGDFAQRMNDLKSKEAVAA